MTVGGVVQLSSHTGILDPIHVGEVIEEVAGTPGAGKKLIDKNGALVFAGTVCELLEFLAGWDATEDIEINATNE
mgnify:CR=1 FL=1